MIARGGEKMAVKSKEKKPTRREKNIDKRLDKLTLKLIAKLERAIDELDDLVSTVTIKEKSIEYDDSKKPVLERTVERDELCTGKGPVDRAALKQLVSILRELKGKEAVEDTDEGIQIVMSTEAQDFSV